MPLDIAIDPIDLTAALVDIPSVSHDEERIADEVEAALRALDRFEVLRVGNNVLARTDRGLPQRVMLAGHLDTVPIADNVPSRREGGVLHGCGTVDMKSGDAVFLHLAATMADPAYDLTLIFYECEEIASQFNGLGRIERELPAWLRADVAILGEPSGGLIEAGCQGTIRVRITASGVRAHSARSWLGDNAIHKLGPVLTALQAYTARTVDIDGCEYREGLSAVKIEGGVAGNVVPDEAFVDVNFRFAPDRTVDEAVAHVREVLAGPLADGALGFEVTDAAPGALPGLGAPAAAELVAAAGGRFRAKYGWTDVSRFAALGIPAVNFGPGDPNYAHKRDEHVEIAQITEVAAVLRAFLAG
ncbi:succinyl-diaminopimelate desuccinylase [Tsukamurella tyrosinosolvens]|uniref:succinyl-diaminopimelate desuccinylase n=1 Tax=Tsukamurella tyrosinosolvens TaxID=57704 RepID=UPI0007982734|nr:succinyl-diaminopimelate desuccinylase [Tsukamurella tyrosinosolvens]KXP08956.1 succinyl-diaminopimelate desuccinylase [Tsukamurella tyrosinosolvens]KZL97184.1 succinyl-diaminopimelate desuccinylase [Tsukamurella tyrosinosolvens]MCA4996921.1 succinyl-diaminopimelate desuccinylase [Tsukamurella tyrosinosolvens]QRY86486.1 succinyl-diaminopimelate desuccinylase [Tsukamurella tyrosinosolvens]WEL94307.1 succinyl-diaminopimelate desuccinylase [Tsukamurella tyrosinosolvens]